MTDELTPRETVRRAVARSRPDYPRTVHSIDLDAATRHLKAARYLLAGLPDEGDQPAYSLSPITRSPDADGRLVPTLIVREFPSPHPARNEGGSWQVVLCRPDEEPVSWTYLAEGDLLALLADLVVTGGLSVGRGVTIPDHDTSEYRTASEQYVLELSLVPYGYLPDWDCHPEVRYVCHVCQEDYDPSTLATCTPHDHLND